MRATLLFFVVVGAWSARAFPQVTLLQSPTTNADGASRVDVMALDVREDPHIRRVVWCTSAHAPMDKTKGCDSSGHLRLFLYGEGKSAPNFRLDGPSSLWIKRDQLPSSVWNVKHPAYLEVEVEIPTTKERVRRVLELYSPFASGPHTALPVENQPDPPKAAWEWITLGTLGGVAVVCSLAFLLWARPWRKRAKEVTGYDWDEGGDWNAHERERREARALAGQLGMLRGPEENWK